MNKKLSNIFYVLFCFIFGTAQLYAQYNTSVKVKLLIDDSTEYINVKAEATNLDEVIFSGRYVLTIIVGDITNEEENATKNQQKGNVILTANESKLVCNTTISVAKNQKAVALLLIYNEDDKLIGKDRWTINDSSDTTPLVLEKVDLVKEREGVSIRGIITEDTKTKPGKDFFREFYSLFLLNEIKIEDPTSVEENFAQGRNTVIEVKVGNTIVARFLTRPSIDYMKQMASASITNVKKHILRQQNKQRQLQGI